MSILVTCLPMLVALLLGGCSDYDVTRVQREDVFRQGDPDVPADILWVVDNSASMREEQNAVATQVGSFLDALALSGLDYRIGVVTTDVSETPGALVGAILTPDTPDLAAALLTQVNVGTGGDRSEQPLEAVRAALSEPLASGPNADIARAEARLAVIVLSDEDDHSPEAVPAYLEDLAARKAAGGYRVSAIAGGLPEGCASPAAQAEAGARLHEAATTSGGAFESICATDFGAILARLGLEAGGMADRFALTALPAEDSLEVFVDGARIHNRPSDGWTYDAGDNAVVFDGYAIPRPGQGIEVRYYDFLGRAADTATE